MSENRDKGLTRDFRIDRAKIDKEKRTVELAFSSETPVERWGENEILSHAKGDYDFSRLNDNHPLLLGHAEHDPMSQIGVIEPGTARVDSDKVGRCTVRFSKGPLGEQIFQDVQDGIRTLVSVGYDRTALASSEKMPDGMMNCRYRWTPTHVAIVPVPADTKAGVGREKVDSPQKPNAEERETKTDFMADKPAAEVNETEIRAKAQADAKEALKKRRQELRTRGDAIVKDFPQAADKVRSMVDEATETEESVDSVSFRMLREAGAIKPAKKVFMADLGMNADEQQNYSILRGIQSCLKRNSRIPDGLEGEVHGELMKRNIGVEFSGFAVPADAPVRCRPTRRAQRDMQVSVFGQGGATVATQLVTPVIEILRNRMVTERLGVRTMAGLEGMVAIPRQTGAGTAYAVTEIAGLTISNQAIDQIGLTPKRVGAYSQYSKQLLLQSSIDVENFIRDDLLKVIAIDWDRLILNGSGANNEPLGIMQTPGVGSVVFGAAATYAKLVNFKTQVATANADVGEMAYVTTPTAEGQLRTIAKLLTGATTVAATALWEGPFGADSPDGIVAGFRAASTNQIPNNQMLFGVFSEVIHALWGGYDVVVNPYSLDTQAEVRITINTFGDVAVRHPQCFCVSVDSAAQ